MWQQTLSFATTLAEFRVCGQMLWPFEKFRKCRKRALATADAHFHSHILANYKTLAQARMPSTQTTREDALAIIPTV